MDTMQVRNEIVAAIQSGDIEKFHRVIQENPEWPGQGPYSDAALGYPHDISTDSLATFKAFVECFPQTKDWHCSHMGNPVGIAAIRGDLPLLRYLLEELGHRANEGHSFYSPVLTCVLGKPDRAEVVKLLKKHGATLEGEGDCYQRSHRLWNGRLCWHKGGKPNYPKCSWSVDDSDDPPGPLDQIRMFFGIQ